MARKRRDSNLNERILRALKRASMLTKDLAQNVNEDAARVYSHCRRLESAGSVKSSLVEGKRLLYCVEDQEVVTVANYDTCRDEGHELRFFFIKERLWSLV